MSNLNKITARKKALEQVLGASFFNSVKGQTIIRCGQESLDTVLEDSDDKDIIMLGTLMLSLMYRQRYVRELDAQYISTDTNNKHYSHLCYPGLDDVINDSRIDPFVVVDETVDNNAIIKQQIMIWGHALANHEIPFDLDRFAVLFPALGTTYFNQFRPLAEQVPVVVREEENNYNRIARLFEEAITTVTHNDEHSTAFKQRLHELKTETLANFSLHHRAFDSYVNCVTLAAQVQTLAGHVQARDLTKIHIKAFDVGTKAFRKYSTCDQVIHALIDLLFVIAGMAVGAFFGAVVGGLPGALVGGGVGAAIATYGVWQSRKSRPHDSLDDLKTEATVITNQMNRQ